MCSYWIPIEIPFANIAPFLENPGKWDGVYYEVSVEINLYGEGREPIWEYKGEWCLPPVGNYPDEIKDAISKYLDSIDCHTAYGHLAFKIHKFKYRYYDFRRKNL